jgi:GT2 family glycosyltransferase
MPIHVLVLNYNGRKLLADCLPSVIEAAAASRHDCRTAVIDNGSTDDSLAVLRQRFPNVRVFRRPNRGLCSFNAVLAELDGAAAVLLNNDIRLAPDAIDPLVAPLLEEGTDCFLTAPLCWRFDGQTYEGLRTAVRWRWGLVQATALFPGNEALRHAPGLTASAGAVIGVSLAKFLALGGFDPLYLPGRLEDLDLAFRGYQAGWHARYVPQSVAWHLGQATFEREFGAAGCDALALRNTLLFQWKNLRHPLHLLRQAVGLPVRLALDLVRAPGVRPERRFAFARALLDAARRWKAAQQSPFRGQLMLDRELRFFRRFHPSCQGGLG